MEKEVLHNELREVIIKLAQEIDGSKKIETQLKKIIKEIFPTELYRALRPDVVQLHGNDSKSLINHFFSTCLDETSFEGKSELILKSDTGIASSIRYARDLWPSRHTPEKKLSIAQDHVFLKTLGTTESIDANDAHNRAKSNTIIHLKSNSLFTWIPKINCSSIRYSIAVDNGAISDINDIDWIHQNNHAFSASNKEILAADNSFVILRNPFKRLVSYFLDKICHVSSSPSDLSYQFARDNFQTDDQTTFKDFVDIIYSNPSLIDKDLHTTRQCDFLVYRNYTKYYALERFEEAKKSIFEITGLSLVDVRDSNSIKTTKGKESCEDIDCNTTAVKIREYLISGKRPIARNMYTPLLLAKVSSIYLSDIILYSDKAPNSHQELEEWMYNLSVVKCL